MVTKREWYIRVNAEWPYENYPEGVLPELTMEEAIRATKKLYRFATGKPWFRKVGNEKFTWRQASGNRYNRARRGILNPSAGWHVLIHSLSHWLAPGGHGTKHARMEIRLIKEVKRRGWLDGKLKTAPKESPAKPARSVIVSTKMEHASLMLKKAATRAKRATTILKKWQRKVRHYERQAAVL